MDRHKIGRLWKFKISDIDEWVRAGNRRRRTRGAAMGTCSEWPWRPGPGEGLLERAFSGTLLPGLYRHPGRHAVSLPVSEKAGG